MSDTGTPAPCPRSPSIHPGSPPRSGLGGGGWGRRALGVRALTDSPCGSRRAAALQEGLRQAVAVPLALADTVASLWPALQELARCGNLACRSDLQVR